MNFKKNGERGRPEIVAEINLPYLNRIYIKGTLQSDKARKYHCRTILLSVCYKNLFFYAIIVAKKRVPVGDLEIFEREKNKYENFIKKKIIIYFFL